jgi:hypothetical protein
MNRRPTIAAYNTRYPETWRCVILNEVKNLYL